MVECRAVLLAQAVAQLETIIQGIYQYPDLRAEMLPHAKDSIARSAAWVWLERSGIPISDLDLNFRIFELRTQLAGNNPCSPELAVHSLEGIRNQIITVLSAHKFAFIPAEVSGYFEQEQLFGGPVFALFPEAQADIKESGNCLAAELYTGAVFYLMRTAEHGLRALARKVKVTLTHKGKPQPIDTATWEKVIAGVKAKLSRAHTMRFGPDRSEKIRFYSDLADRCSFVKDLYRNDVMHSRARFEKRRCASRL
jgi:hypothetical protein